jgi:hypothetical protein
MTDEAKLLADLRAGSAGVQRWNARPAEERQAAVTGGVDLSGAALAGADFGGLDLRGACFAGATLTEAWLLEANLEGADFAGATLREAWAAGAKFRAANFGSATLWRANFRDCDCRGASFLAADLSGATLIRADLCGADLSTANLRDVTVEGARYDAATRWPPSFRPREALEWAGGGDAPITLDLFVKRLGDLVDPRRLARAVEMLKAERFRLYTQVEPDSILGVVKSQTSPDLAYSCRLTADGRFGCCTPNLAACLGLRGALCKHLLVLVVGLTRGGELPAASAEAWVRASRDRKPVIDPDVMAETLLRYKGAEAGEVDWRPTETIPEDYYTL